MPPRTATHTSARIDVIAAGWGGIAAAIGLMLAGDRSWPWRLTIVAAGFGLGGFLAGVRAADRRLTHAVGAWLVAHAVYAAFAALAHLLGWLGGPDAPELMPGSRSAWLAATIWALACALGGGALTRHWLGSGRRRRG